VSHVVLCFSRYREGPWIIRIDSKHGDQPHHKRHIHIKRKGLGGEYSWNEDGTRHDKYRFPVSEDSIQAAKRIAAERLGINQAMLQFMAFIPEVQEISVIELSPHHNHEMLSAIFVGGEEEIYVLIYEDRLVFVSWK
jgi:hypothetical protein